MNTTTRLSATAGATTLEVARVGHRPPWMAARGFRDGQSAADGAEMRASNRAWIAAVMGLTHPGEMS